MWRDIFLSNKTALLRLIDTFQEALAETAALIENDQAEQLMDQLARAKSARDYFASQPRSSSSSRQPLLVSGRTQPDGLRLQQTA